MNNEWIHNEGCCYITNEWWWWMNEWFIDCINIDEDTENVDYKDYDDDIDIIGDDKDGDIDEMVL